MNVSVGIGIIRPFAGYNYIINKPGVINCMTSGAIGQTYLAMGIIREQGSTSTSATSTELLNYGDANYLSYDFDENIPAFNLESIEFETLSNDSGSAMQFILYAITDEGKRQIGSISCGAGSNLFKIGSFVLKRNSSTGQLITLCRSDGTITHRISTSGSQYNYSITVDSASSFGTTICNGALVVATGASVAQDQISHTNDSLTDLESDVLQLSNTVNSFDSRITNAEESVSRLAGISASSFVSR